MKLCFVIFIFVFFYPEYVNSFTWQSCGSSTDPVKVTSLSATLVNPRLMQCSGSGKVAMNLTAPIKVKLEVKKKFFWGWTAIPCVDDIGSCTYEDVCAMSPYLGGECPPEFTNNQLPCNCPILQGQYVAKKFPINLEFLPSWVEKGVYKIKMSLFKDNQELLCLMVTDTL